MSIFHYMDLHQRFSGVEHAFRYIEVYSSLRTLVHEIFIAVTLGLIFLLNFVSGAWFLQNVLLHDRKLDYGGLNPLTPNWPMYRTLMLMLIK